MANYRYRWGMNPIGSYQKVVLPWHRPETPDQHEENVRALERIDWGSAQGTRWRTIVIAASDSTAASKSTADYVCNGTADQNVINGAITLLMTSRSLTQTTGRIVLLEGLYRLTGSINYNAFTSRSLFIEGMGAGIDIGSGNTICGTRVTVTGNDYCFYFAGNSAAAGSSVVIENIECRGSSSTALIGTRDMVLNVRQCNIVNGGAGGGIAQTNSTGQSGNTRIENNVIVTNAGYGVDLAGSAVGTSVGRVTGNFVTTNGVNSRGISVQNNISNNPQYVVSDNVVRSNTNNGTYGILFQGNSTLYGLVANNIVMGSVDTGISMSGYASEIVGNYIVGATNGIRGTAFQMDQCLIASNTVQGGTVGVWVGQSGAVSSTKCSVIGNKLCDITTAIQVGTGGIDTGIFGNDTYNSTTWLTDAGTRTRTDKDLPGLVGYLIPTGGTASQVLKKNSATNFDVSWARDPTLDLVQARGDILTGDAQYSLVRTGIGRTDTLFQADRTTASGVKWGPKLTVGTVAPSDPIAGDIWIDTT